MEVNLNQFDHKPKVTKKKLNILPSNPEIDILDDENAQAVGLGRFPSWLHRKLPKGSELWETKQIMREQHLHTVCEEAKCPNLLECWSKKTATYLIMGKECTRSCGFCEIAFSKKPLPLDIDEPMRVAESVKQLGLRHVVITMVARDDIPDGGAAHFVKVIEAIRTLVPDATIETLTSDLAGNLGALDHILGVYPEIFNHNIETVRALTPQVRHKATYERTLTILKHAHEFRNSKLNNPILIKSGIMVGLGETIDQVKETLNDLHRVGCDIVTIGQYLQPGHHKLRVKAFITPEQFKDYEEYGYSIGIKNMYCGPFIRSSYNANLVLKNAKEQKICD